MIKLLFYMALLCFCLLNILYPLKFCQYKATPLFAIITIWKLDQSLVLAPHKKMN